jgi:hypothetical protein
VASYVPNCGTCDVLEEEEDVDDDCGGKEDVDEELGTTLVVVMAFLSRFVLRCMISVFNYRRESCDIYVDYLQDGQSRQRHPLLLCLCCRKVWLTIKNESTVSLQ